MPWNRPLIIAVLVLAVILVFVIPVFEEMFADFGGELPVPTQIVVAMSDMVKSKIVYILVGLVLFVIAFKKFYGTEKGREIVDNMLLKLPVFGDLLRKVAVAKFTRTMGTMLASGVAILEALDIVAKTAGNKTVEKAVYSVRKGIAEGLEPGSLEVDGVCQHESRHRRDRALRNQFRNPVAGAVGHPVAHPPDPSA